MTFKFSKDLLDKHIAPGVSDFTHAEIPDMSEWTTQSRFWVANLFLNSVVTATFNPPMNAYAYNFIRRVQYAYSEHNLARVSTRAFLEVEGQSPRLYADLLFHWENFLGQAWHGYNILSKISDGKVFDKNDGSIEQRLNALYNQMKHVESRIENKQIIEGATVPVWLENSGLVSVEERLSFQETAEVLKYLAKYADALMNPLTSKEVLDAFDA